MAKHHETRPHIGTSLSVRSLVSKPVECLLRNTRPLATESTCHGVGAKIGAKEGGCCSPHPATPVIGNGLTV